MLWQLYAGHSISSASREADIANGRARRAENRARSSEDAARQNRAGIEFLAIRCQAMWEVMSEQLQLTDQMLLDRMQEIDLRDGKLDGRMSAPVQNCMSCDRPVNLKRKQCLYCGEDAPRGPEVFNA